MENNMIKFQLRCRQTKAGILILQAYSEHIRIRVPETIRGLPVTEIGPYCFSASVPGQDPDTSFFCSIESDDTFSKITVSSIEINTIPPADGRYLEEIYLPSSVNVLHNAAFYNCRKLSVLGIGPKITAIGSDVFTNCTKLSLLYYAGKDTDVSALSLILGRLDMDLRVLFTDTCDTGGHDNPDNTIVGSLFFPEYYEWLDEVTPAHLFSRSIHGEGFRMRKCFRDNQIDYGKYDACFDNALKTESEKTLCRIALCRLRWPAGLSGAQKYIYQKALLDRLATAAALAIEDRDLPLLTFIFTRLSPGKPAIEAVLAQCINADWGEAAAFLIEQSRQFCQNSMLDKNYDFDEF